MLDEPLQPGDIVAGLESNEHVEIQKIALFASKTLIEGVGVTSRRYGNEIAVGGGQ